MLSNKTQAEQQEIREVLLKSSDALLKSSDAQQKSSDAQQKSSDVQQKSSDALLKDDSGEFLSVPNFPVCARQAD